MIAPEPNNFAKSRFLRRLFSPALWGSKQHPPVHPPVTDRLRAGAAACNRLGGNMLDYFLKNKPQDGALTSPLSLSLLLAILACGATDALSQGYDKLLGASGKNRNQVWSALQSTLSRYDGKLANFSPHKVPHRSLIHLANHIVIVEDRGTHLKQSYLKTLEDWFPVTVEVETVELSALKETLDTWGAHHTAGLIPESGVNITQDTVLVVQSVLLFAARWLKPFNSAYTHAEDFNLAGGLTVQAPFMHDTQRIPYAEADGWTAVRLAYRTGKASDSSDLALDIVLPEAGTLPSDMDAKTWAAASEKLNEAANIEVAVALPKLDISSQADKLLPFLEFQGLDTKSLDGIAPGLGLSQVVQQARLMVDEGGTVAAALTEANFRFTGAPSLPKLFTVDHPYVLRLRDLKSGVALLEAVIMDPTVKKLKAE